MVKNYSDDLSPNSGKHFMPIDAYNFNPILYTQISTSAYLLAEKDAIKAKQKNDLPFISNNNVWEQVILNNVRGSNTKLILHSFFLFEWFPRSPGLFHTEEGFRARQEAKNRIISSKDGFIVYDPLGKLSMLEGGFGNIRLKAINLTNGSYYFMTASDNGICHEGFPVALPEDLYNEVINDINERGAVVKDLIGVLRSVPEDIDNLYRGFKKVPKVYLQVEELRNPTYPKSRSIQEMSVTVASSFISNYEGPSKIYASYIGFNPSQRGQLDENVEWMENEYVKGMYSGRILTDFDQTTNHFAYAPFSLSKVMNLEVKSEDINSLAAALGIDERDVFTIQNEMKAHLKAESKLTPQTVFISYNHNDVKVAKAIQKRLVSEGFKVIRDEDNIITGESIPEFIKNSIRQSKFTLSIISRNSLESAWVAMETILTDFSEALMDRVFLPVHIDKDFFDIRFVSEALDKIDEKVEEVRDLMGKQLGKGRGIEDLQDHLTRLNKLKNNLPEIVGKLKGLKCTDLSTSEFDSGMNKLVDDIKKRKDD